MSDHSLFSHSATSDVIMLIVYVDDIIISESDCVGIVDLKAYLSHQIHTKNLNTLRYFLRIKVTKMGVYLSQRKYVLDLLSETWMLNSLSIDAHMNYHVNFDAGIGELFAYFRQ